jgi:hypothetical protein
MHQRPATPVEYTPHHPQALPQHQAQPAPHHYLGESPDLGVPEMAPDSLPIPDDSQSDMPDVQQELFGPPVEP